MRSQQNEPPPLPLDDEAFEEVPLLVKEIEAAIRTASGNELKVLRLMAEHLKNVDRKTVDVSKMIAALENRFDRVDEAIGDNRDALMMANYNVTQALRLARKIPRVLQTAEATLIAADGARVAAEAGVAQSRLTRTTLDMLARMRAEERPEKTAVIPVHEVSARDVVSEEEETASNVIPIRRTRRSPIAVAATIAMTFATAAFSMSGMPYKEERPSMDCRRVADAHRDDLYDCGSGHLWVAMRKVPNASGGVDLDLKPYAR